MYMIKEKVSEGLSRLFNDSPNSDSSSSTSSFATNSSGKSKARPYSPEGRSLSSYFSYVGFGHKEEPGAKLYKSLLVASSDDPSEKTETSDGCGSESPPYESYVTPKCDQHTVLEISKTMGDKEEGDDPGSGNSSSSTDVFKEASESHCPEKPLQNLMDQDSAFISPELYEFLSSCLPNIVKGCQWVLMYSTAKHGISLRTLIRKSSESSGPCLVIAGDMQGAVFGGLLDCPLKPTSKRKYQGSHQTFVFTTVYGEPRLFRATGSNRYYYICMNDLLALGGGGNFALRLDSDLLNATSGPCETFGSLCLAHKPEFELKNVELWGFAHMSDYVK